MEVKGLNKENIIKISDYKKEDDWVKEFRLKSFDAFSSMGDQLPFGPPFSLDFDKIISEIKNPNIKAIIENIKPKL